MEVQFISTDKSLNHLVKKFQGCIKDKRPFWVSDYDVLCINNVVDHIERDREKKPYRHSLFSKLFVFLYGQLLIKYQTTVFDEIPQRVLSRIIERPLSNHIKDFLNQLNANEAYLLIRDFSDNADQHPALDSNKNVVDVDVNVWDYQTVREHLQAMISEALNRFSNDSEG